MKPDFDFDGMLDPPAKPEGRVFSVPTGGVYCLHVGITLNDGTHKEGSIVVPATDGNFEFVEYRSDDTAVVKNRDGTHIIPIK